jgi:hypothetical protein
MIGANPKNNTKNITTACHRIPHLASAAPGMPAPKKQTAQFSDTTRLITPKPQYGTRERKLAQHKARHESAISPGLGDKAGGRAVHGDGRGFCFKFSPCSGSGVEEGRRGGRRREALETRLAAARYMATDEGFASSSALALVLGSRRDGEAEEKGGRLAELLFFFF